MANLIQIKDYKTPYGDIRAEVFFNRESYKLDCTLTTEQSVEYYGEKYGGFVWEKNPVVLCITMIEDEPESVSHSFTYIKATNKYHKHNANPNEYLMYPNAKPKTSEKLKQYLIDFIQNTVFTDEEYIKPIAHKAIEYLLKTTEEEITNLEKQIFVNKEKVNLLLQLQQKY
jgi:hypothetical protein